MKKVSSQDNLILDGTLLSSDENLPELVEVFKKKLVEHPSIPVILELSHLTMIYSKGISIVLGFFKDCKAKQREFSIHIGNEEVFNLFKMLKLDKVIQIQKVTV